jgi:hypothetical protein
LLYVIISSNLITFQFFWKPFQNDLLTIFFWLCRIQVKVSRFGIESKEEKIASNQGLLSSEGKRGVTMDLRDMSACLVKNLGINNAKSVSLGSGITTKPVSGTILLYLTHLFKPIEYVPYLAPARSVHDPTLVHSTISSLNHQSVFRLFRRLVTGSDLRDPSRLSQRRAGRTVTSPTRSHRGSGGAWAPAWATA